MNYTDFVTANADAFLRSRSIGFDMLATLAREQGFDDAQVLLTSSPVHGIATATSDIDLICVTPQAVSKGQMATQIHRDGQHCEILPIGTDDLDRAFADLALLSRCALPQRLAGYQRWDSGHAVRKKYLERIVYAVATDGKAYHLAHLGALVPVAAAQEYDAFHQSRVCAALAQRAGEPDAARGYLINACLSAMAAALSLGGWVLSNKKWTLRRWREAAGPHMRVVDAWLQERLTAMWSSVGEPSCAASARGIAALDEVDRRLGVLMGAPSLSNAMPHTDAPCTQAALDKRSAFLIGNDGRARLAATTEAQAAPADLASLATLSAAHAASLLRSARSGTLSFSLMAASSCAEEKEDVHALAD
ncbi:hypothetical protein SAMN05518854_114102 [Variovorax sp. YR266]|uniref:DUF6001 family protein n=1 Tax=Variovorax sp. YR266 TaxID=1884386 RepID=UPI0008961BF3|nr:DUF6001 family protein [Variovorax sp. YR266]SDZ70503.1 hypothetical protein SAMN05518854_114102 [Variovorax sp. YR266]